MTQPDYQPPATAATPAAFGRTTEVPTPTPQTPTELAAAAPQGPPAKVSRGLLVAAWVAAVSLALLALVAVVWTVELIRIQLELQETARTVRDYIVHLGGALGGGGATQCPNGEPFC